MLNTILILFRTIFLILGGHEQVALENLALREQLEIFQRSVHRPKIRQRDRLFWVCLRKVWKQWRSALVIVQPETVLDWQRRRFKRYWCQLSRRQNPGRPRTAADCRKAREEDGRDKLGLGRTSHSWGVAQTGNSGVGTDGFPPDAETEHDAVSEVANLPGQSRA